MTTDDLLDLCYRMRLAQKKSERTKTTMDQREAKDYEARVDSALAVWQTRDQKELFGD